MHAGIYCHSYTIITLVVVAGLQQKKAYAEAYSYFRTEVKVLSRLQASHGEAKAEAKAEAKGRVSRIRHCHLLCPCLPFAICHLPSAICPHVDE